MVLRVLHWSVWELTITRSRASWPGLCLTLTFKYMKLRRKDRSIICCPVGYPPPLSVSESTPALYQALEYSLEGLRPKTWAEEIYPPPGIYLQSHFRSLAFLVQQTSCCKAEKILCSPSLGQGASQWCTYISLYTTRGEAGRGSTQPAISL